MPIKVELLPHDPRWQSLAAAESERLRAALGEVLVTVHHIGAARACWDMKGQGQVGIRETAQSELPGILPIHERAFGQTEEAELVRAILGDPTAQPTLSLIAEAESRPLGHILFSRARVSDAPPDLAAAILAPLAVVPEAQGKGIGGALIGAGLAQLRDAGVTLVFVLGDPGYYNRFGFAAAGRHGLVAPYAIPPEHAEAWMVQALREGVLGEVKGSVTCCDALMKPELWLE